MSRAIGGTLLGLMVLLFASHLGYAQNAEWLRAHNKYRCMHGVPPVKWSTTVAKSAQNYANTCPSLHSGPGENMLFADYIMSPTDVVSYWYNSEVLMYNYNNPIYSSSYGHFTQVVWKGTTEIGCGYHTGCVTGAGGYPNVWVCQYKPLGNVETQFATNVLRPIRTEAACAMGVEYHAHVLDIGWQPWVSDWSTAGTTGQSRRMEAVQVRLLNAPAGYNVEYRAHVQGIGWQPWVSNGATAGTTGQSRRMEAVQIRLLNTNVPVAYNVEYRAHVQGIGWQSWVSNGATAGTTGQSRRMEALEIYVYPK